MEGVWRGASAPPLAIPGWNPAGGGGGAACFPFLSKYGPLQDGCSTFIIPAEPRMGTGRGWSHHQGLNNGGALRGYPPRVM